MDENRKSGFCPDEPIIWSQRPYRTGQMFIYSIMEQKINKIRRNLYTSGNLRIWYDDHERNYKPVNDMCFSLILS